MILKVIINLMMTGFHRFSYILFKFSIFVNNLDLALMVIQITHILYI